MTTPRRSGWGFAIGFGVLVAIFMGCLVAVMIVVGDGLS